MFLRPSSVPLLLAISGTAYLLAIAILVVTRTPLGSALFFAMAAVMAVAYCLTVFRVTRGTQGSRRAFLTALGLAVLFRIPLALSPVGADSDMVRYVWDGRVQLRGYNPYNVVPSDPTLAATHTPETAAMPSRRAKTPYPPGAQLFFRLVVAAHDSTLAMKLALVGCDLLTVAIVWRWLFIAKRSEWLTLVYAWHPLVVLEVAHSGHIDGLGAMWIAAAAYWLARRRTMLASIAFVLAVATKLLPVVLAPLFAGRIRVRDVIVGAMLMTALCMPFSSGGTLPLGAVTNVVEYIRFNGPLFRIVDAVASPRLAAATAVLVGAALATWARVRLEASDPSAWAWPMAAALACAPVIYPWYLLYLTPFLFTPATLPLMVWTFSVIPVYLVWQGARQGGRWVVPDWLMAMEFGVVAIAIVWMVVKRRRAGILTREKGE